jgi:hypothetical protein
MYLKLFDKFRIEFLTTKPGKNFTPTEVAKQILWISPISFDPSPLGFICMEA